MALIFVLVGCSTTPTTDPTTNETPTANETPTGDPTEITILPADDTDYEDTNYDDGPSDDSDYDDPTYLEGTYVYETDKIYIVFNQDMTAEVNILDSKNVVPYTIDDDDVYLDFSEQEGIFIIDVSHLEANDDFTELTRDDSEMVFKKQ